MESLMAMLGQMGTVEVSRTVKENDVVEAPLAMALIEEDVIPVVAEIVVKRDDLTIIEGIGPKIAEVLYNDGITSFKQLAITEISYIKVLLERAGSRFQMHKPDSWPEQARIAAEGRWSHLKAWQEELNAEKK
jgi:predicted flap endonuclease-1-like 5' DNA nuclease